MQNRPFTIEMTSEEMALADRIKFDPRAISGDAEVFRENGELVAELTASLLERKAIPEHRRRYFSDPEYHVGGRGSSRRDLFMRRTQDREKMIRHGDFLKYLRYFIHGADLPPAMMDAFEAAVEDCGTITSGDIAPLSSRARQLVRASSLERKFAAEEFYKLCLDLDFSPDNAASIRETLLQLRR